MSLTEYKPMGSQGLDYARLGLARTMPTTSREKDPSVARLSHYKKPLNSLLSGSQSLYSDTQSSLTTAGCPYHTSGRSHILPGIKTQF